jgi:WD40 repeat protein
MRILGVSLLCFVLVSCSNVVAKIPVEKTTINSFYTVYSLSADGHLFAHEIPNGIGIGKTIDWQITNSLYSDYTPIEDIVWNPDNIHIAAIDDYGYISVWNSQTIKQIAFLTSESFLTSKLRWLSDTLLMAVNRQSVFPADTQIIHVWDVPRQRRLLTLKTNNYYITYFKSQIAVVNSDAHIEIYDVIVGEKIKDIDMLDHKIDSLTWSPDGRFLVGTNIGQGKPEITVWDIATEQSYSVDFPNKRIAGDKLKYSWKPNTEQMIIMHADTYLLDISDKKIIETYQNGFEEYNFGLIHLQWSTDGKYLVARTIHEWNDFWVIKHSINFKIWDGETLELLYAPDHDMGIIDLQWIPNTHSLLITDNRGTHIFAIGQ